MKNGDEILSYNPYKPVKKIIGILHECNIPITAIDTVFELVKADIEANTIPYQGKTNENFEAENRKHYAHIPFFSKDFLSTLKFSDWLPLIISLLALFISVTSFILA